MPPSEPLHPNTVEEIKVLHRLASEHEWERHDHYCARSCNCYKDTTYDCPSCKANKEKGHKPDCELKKALLNIGSFLEMQEEANDALERYPDG